MTVVAVPAISTDVEERAVALVGGLLPVRVVTSGVAVFGGPAVTLVRTLDVADEVTRADLAQALEVIGQASSTVSLATLRRWDPEASEVRTLVSTVSPMAGGD